MEKTISAILLMAGLSTRYKKKINKNLEIVNGNPVFLYSLFVLNKIKNIKEIILVIREEEKKQIESYLKNNILKKNIIFVIGGNTRKESVYNSLKYAKYNYVLIHDAARPLIKKEYVLNCIKCIDDYLGVIVGVPVKDTIKIVNANCEIKESTDRNSTWIAQTPQLFNKKTLIELHNKYFKEKLITDDSAFLEKDNIKVKIVKGDYSNIKITTKEDIIFFEQYL